MKLITAEELAERVRGKSCSGYPKWLVPLLRDAQRNALEAAVTRLEGLATNAGDDCAWCVRKMAKGVDPAPAGEETNDGPE
jgi:hypothetical protein